jgi:two-component system sensor histidine kinase MprB
MGLGARLAMVFTAVAVATALLVGGASYVSTDALVTEEVDSFLRQRAKEIADGQRDQPRERPSRRNNGNDDNDDDGDTTDDLAIAVAVGNDAEVQVLDESGVIVSNTGFELPVDATDIKLADDDGDSVMRSVTVEGDDYRMITEHISGGGAVQVARSLDESASVLNSLRTRILLVAAAVGLGAGAVGWFVAQRTTRPLRALSDAVDEVAETRDFAVPVPTSGRDEVGRLGRGFNRMLGALELSQQQQHRLVQDAAHELRTPLTSMTANVEWLMRADDLDADTRRTTLAGVKRELGELNDVMSEIIELATDSHEAPEMVSTDLVAVAHEAVDRFVALSGRKVDVRATPATVVGDADSLTRAVTNLLSNAHKYSPPETPVSVEVGPGGVFVSDAGPGIPADERDQVFDRFYRRAEDRSKPGSGLGLSIVAGIVDQHGGSVSAGESSLGGARVGFELPAG